MACQEPACTQLLTLQIPGPHFVVCHNAIPISANKSGDAWPCRKLTEHCLSHFYCPGSCRTPRAMFHFSGSCGPRGCDRRPSFTNPSHGLTFSIFPPTIDRKSTRL